jgi:glycine/D-amino acid oxidase-like deaminating enzyme
MPAVTRWNPEQSRIGIVGAGPAGLAAARALLRAGYRHVTVFEAGPDPGGKCETGVFAGRAYDLGAVCIFEGYTRTLALAQEVELSLKEAPTYLRPEGGGRELPLPPTGAVKAWAEQVLQKVPALFEGPFESFEDVVRLGLHEPYGAWAQRLGLEPIPALSLYFYQSTGYGYRTQRVPAIYFLRAQFTCTGRVWVAKAGYQELWRRQAQRLVQAGLQLRTRTPVTRVVPGPPLWVETAAAPPVEVDALIWTGGPQEALAALPLTPEQAQALGNLGYIDYRTWVIEGEGLAEAPGRIVMVERNNRPEHLGHVALYAQPHADRPLALAWQYTTSDDDLAHERVALADAQALGAEDPDIRLRRRWSHFFPHFSPEAFERGEPVALERSQGTGNIFFAGATLAMELVESAVVHAEGVVARHFSP